MSTMPRWSHMALCCLALAWVALGLGVSACGDDGGAPAGSERGPCYPNGTCDVGLVCLSQICIDPDACAQGSSQACQCPSGVWSDQACSPLGVWEECDCSEDECVPASTRSCDCSGEETGSQVCDGGGHWGPCACPVCGNAVIEAGEACDGTNLGALSCADYGYSAGILACSSTCAIDHSACSNTPVCGNGLREPPEACDGQDLGSFGCSSFGFDGGQIACRSNCTYDLSGCVPSTTCGNGHVDAGEACDDGNRVDGDGCSADCLSNETCGNGVLDATTGEACDGADLGGETCLSLGFPGGPLGCNPTTCQLDSSSCWSGQVRLESTVWSPGADFSATLEVNRFPIPNVRVTAYPSPEPALPVQNYCHTCFAPPTGVATTFSDPVDGSFHLDLDANTTYYLTLRVGGFRRIRPITTPSSGTMSLNVSPGAARAPEVTLPTLSNLSAGDQIPRIAVVSANYEDLDMVFTALGLTIGGPDISEVQASIVDDALQLANYRVLIVPCGENWTGSNGATLSAWVEAGGTLWVDDFNYDFVEVPFPDFLSLYDGSVECGTPTHPTDGNGTCNNWSSYDFNPLFPDSDLSAWMSLPAVNQGSAPHILAAWDYIHTLYPGEVGIDASCGTGPNGEVYRQPTPIVINADGSPFSSLPPAMVTFPVGCGRVVYTVFHTHSGYAEPYELLTQEKLFVYQVLQAQACRTGLCP